MASNKPPAAIIISYEHGGLALDDWPEAGRLAFPQLAYDPRTLQYRAPAYLYRDLVLYCVQAGLAYEDKAKAYGPLACPLKTALSARPHQEAALKAWQASGKRGVVSLPTGAGKTILAVFAIASLERPTLVVVPTIDLMHQWQQVLASYFGQSIGLLGGGQKQLEPLTVATYDSAALMIEQLGARFGFLVVDECHHLPAACYQSIAYSSLAPFRLGLSATLERSDGGEQRLFELLGPCVYRGEIGEMVADVLAPYDVQCIEVELSEEERRQYEEARGLYLAFVKKQGINFRAADGWRQFIMRSARSLEGKKAFRAYLQQKKLAQAAELKLHTVWQLINAHTREPVIIFTQDNDMAYRLGRELVLPVLTHKTKAKERQSLLSAFRAGELKVLVTSKVLNEGVDVPEARVGIVVSGSGAVREHVQRLGRLLRHYPGKRAILYEIVARNTSEQYVNQRRRQHDAYQRPSQLS